MMTREQDVQEVTILRGQVKWFDPTKGYGFVIADAGGADILLHSNVLRNFGQSSIADGTVIELSVQETERGRQAVEVLDVVLRDHDQYIDARGVVEANEQDSLEPFRPARVKWFDKFKGFGFANIYGSTEDVFVHVEVLQRSGLADLQAGEAISLRVSSGERGQMAIAVAPWDVAEEARTQKS